MRIHKTALPRRWRLIAVLFVVLALIAYGCGNDAEDPIDGQSLIRDDDSYANREPSAATATPVSGSGRSTATPVATEAPEETIDLSPGEGRQAAAGNSEEPSTGGELLTGEEPSTGGSAATPVVSEVQEVDVTLIPGESQLLVVLDRGYLRCGGRSDLPGFGRFNSDGSFSGLDIDMCRVVAAAVLGDADAVEIVPVTRAERFPALQTGAIDVLIRNTTWTATRDGYDMADFLFTTYYDGQGIMVPVTSELTTLEDLANANICSVIGTVTEFNLSMVLSERGIPYTPVVFEDFDSLVPAYEEGQCEAMTADVSTLGLFKHDIERSGGVGQHIMSEVISREPLGPVVRDGDSVWAQVVNWAVMATVQAWEFGLNSTNIYSYDGIDPNILNFLGRAGFDPGLGLPTDFAVQVVSQVGNYEEIFNRYPQLGTLAGTLNDLWTNGGLMYVPPYR